MGFKKIKNKLMSNNQDQRMIKDWQTLYRQEPPKIAALLSSAVGGSHFILHKLQGHPQLVSLKEKVLYPDLKKYFNFQNYEVKNIEENQLLPEKSSLKNVSWIVVNKPVLRYVVYHFPFQRDNIRLIKLIRNPMGLYYSWLRGTNKMAQRDYGKDSVDLKAFQSWIDAHIMSGLSSFAFSHNPTMDIAINLESLSSNTDQNLQTVYNCLGIENIPAHKLAKLTHCVNCNELLGTKPTPVKSGIQESLYCSTCDKSYLGAGGYNYIRVVDPENLASWKTKPDAEKVYKHFSSLLGKPFMEYFENEIYLQEDSVERFDDVFRDLIEKILWIKTSK